MFGVATFLPLFATSEKASNTTDKTAAVQATTTVTTGTTQGQFYVLCSTRKPEDPHAVQVQQVHMCLFAGEMSFRRLIFEPVSFADSENITKTTVKTTTTEATQTTTTTRKATTTTTGGTTTTVAGEFASLVPKQLETSLFLAQRVWFVMNWASFAPCQSVS